MAASASASASAYATVTTNIATATSDTPTDTSTSTPPVITDSASIAAFNRGPVKSLFTPASSCVRQLTMQSGQMVLGHWYSGDPACYPSGSMPASDMLPSTAWNQFYYSPAVCPVGWSSALSIDTGTLFGYTDNEYLTIGSETTAVLCCPSGFQYYADDHACSALLASGAVVTYISPDVYSISMSNQITETTTLTTSTIIVADGLPVLWQSSDSEITALFQELTTAVLSSSSSSSPSSSSSSTTTSSATSISSSAAPTSPSASSGGLSTGAEIGIGVGVGVVALALLAGLFFFMRSRRTKKKQQQQKPDLGPQGGMTEAGHNGENGYPNNGYPPHNNNGYPTNGYPINNNNTQPADYNQNNANYNNGYHNNNNNNNANQNAGAYNGYNNAMANPNGGGYGQPSPPVELSNAQHSHNLGGAAALGGGGAAAAGHHGGYIDANKYQVPTNKVQELPSDDYALSGTIRDFSDYNELEAPSSPPHTHQGQQTRDRYSAVPTHEPLDEGPSPGVSPEQQHASQAGGEAGAHVQQQQQNRKTVSSMGSAAAASPPMSPGARQAEMQG